MKVPAQDVLDMATVAVVAWVLTTLFVAMSRMQ